MATNIPTLAQIIALRTNDGSVASIKDVIARAEAMRASCLDSAVAARRDARSQLMTGTLASIKAAETSAEEANLAADRAGVVLGELQNMLAAAVAAEAEAGRAALVAAAVEADKTYLAVWGETWPAATEAAARIVEAYRRANEAINQAIANVPGGDIGALPRQALTMEDEWHWVKFSAVLEFSRHSAREQQRLADLAKAEDTADRERRAAQQRDAELLGAQRREAQRLAELAEREGRGTTLFPAPPPGQGVTITPGAAT